MIIPLNNSINSSALDSDAIDFISTCGITASNVIRGINTCFKELKSYDIWDRIYYGFVMVNAGTTASMLVDIKSRQSLSIITPLSIPGTNVTYSVTGIQYNNADFHAILGAPFSDRLNTDSAPGHISIWNRTDYNSLGITVSSKHGFLELGGYEQSISFSPSGVSASLWNVNGPMGFSCSTSGFFVFSNVDDNLGRVAASRTPYKFYLSRNGFIIGSQSSNRNLHTFGSNIIIGGFVDSSIFAPSVRSIDEISWYSIGSGFGANSSTGRHIDINQQEKFYQIIQKLQTNLNR